MASKALFRAAWFATSLATTTTSFTAPIASRISRTAPLSSQALWATKQYSKATMARVEGLDAQQELDKLSAKLNTPADKLMTILSTQLAGMEDASSDKAEYIDWLLSNTNNGAQPPKKSKKVAGEKKGHKKSAPKNSQPQPQTFVTDIEFNNRDDLHPNSKQAIAKMGLTSMTEIQAKTFAAASSGKDVLGRARTGTGKTVAFLLPAIERVLNLPKSKTKDSISILVVSPTRELANQIAQQAKELTQFQRDMSVQVMFGGTSKNTDVNRIKERLPSILVATPGRLLDHLQNTMLGRQQFGSTLSKAQVLVLDETDRLLDMGFRREIEKIIRYLPSDRQTLLFSATIPPGLKDIMARTMQPDFIEVDCIHDDEEPTNAKVQQSHIVVPDDRLVSSVVEIVRLANEESSKAKIVVFFTTARLVNFYAEVFNQGKILPVLELHSKKTQSYRNRVSEEFRKCDSGILFTSDVSARGVDYPGVSHVIQFGIPDSSEQYIHRLGRTGRAGADGRGWLVLSEWETPFLKELKGVVEIPVENEVQRMIDSPISTEAEDLVQEVRRRVRGGDKILAKSASGAYQAFLGYYLGQIKRMQIRRKDELVDIANDFASLAGLYEPPALTSQMVGKMGLRGISGLNVQSKASAQDQDGRHRQNTRDRGDPRRKGRRHQ